MFSKLVKKGEATTKSPTAPSLIKRIFGISVLLATEYLTLDSTFPSINCWVSVRSMIKNLSAEIHCKGGNLTEIILEYLAGEFQFSFEYRNFSARNADYFMLDFMKFATGWNCERNVSSC